MKITPSRNRLVPTPNENPRNFSILSGSQQKIRRHWAAALVETPTEGRPKWQPTPPNAARKGFSTVQKHFLMQKNRRNQKNSAQGGYFLT